MRPFSSALIYCGGSRGKGYAMLGCVVDTLGVPIDG